MERQHLSMGIFGLGCVGQGLVDILHAEKKWPVSILKICVRNPSKQRIVPPHWLTFEPDDILYNPDIDVVIELIDDADSAYRYVKMAIQNRKNVITANKKMMALHFRELHELARKYNVSLLYEAACCASLPIIRSLEEYYDNDLLTSIEGIVNGSTNYILTRLFQHQETFQEALAEACRLGYAESDPALDVEGWDSKYKLCILLSHAFGLLCEPHEIFHWGIEHLGALETIYAREKGCKIKLLAHAKRRDCIGDIESFVLPTFVYPDHELFDVDEAYNGIRTSTAYSDVQFFKGKGAGAFPTASAVLSDISALTFRYRYEIKKWSESEKLAMEKEVKLKVWIGTEIPNECKLNDFVEETYETYLGPHGQYITGMANLADLRKLKADWQGKARALHCL